MSGRWESVRAWGVGWGRTWGIFPAGGRYGDGETNDGGDYGGLGVFVGVDGADVDGEWFPGLPVGSPGGGSPAPGGGLAGGYRLAVRLRWDRDQRTGGGCRGCRLVVGSG